MKNCSNDFFLRKNLKSTELHGHLAITGGLYVVLSQIVNMQSYYVLFAEEWQFALTETKKYKRVPHHTAPVFTR